MRRFRAVTGHIYLLFYFGCTVDELMVPEVVLVVLDQFNERNEQTPRMRPVDDQTLQKNSEKRKERERERERERDVLKAGPPPPLEAILVIFGRRALIFFVWKGLEKNEKWRHFCAHAQWWSPWRRKNVEKGHLAPSNLTFLIMDRLHDTRAPFWTGIGTGSRARQVQDPNGGSRVSFRFWSHKKTIPSSSLSFLAAKKTLYLYPFSVVWTSTQSIKTKQQTVAYAEGGSGGVLPPENFLIFRLKNTQFFKFQGTLPNVFFSMVDASSSYSDLTNLSLPR